MINNQQKQNYSINLYLRKKQMSNKLVIKSNLSIRSRQTSSYLEQSSQSAGQPHLVMYDCLRSIARKQLRYPFQLLKQYILFSDEQSSIQVGYKHMRHQLEIIQVNLNAFCSLIKQKMLVTGFINIKYLYQKKLRVEAAYLNKQNLQNLTHSILVVQNLHRLWLQWQIFNKLYQNYKGIKLSKINLSKIDLINNDYTSKQLMQFQPFLNDKIEMINSFIIDKNSQQHEEEIIDEEVVVKKLQLQRKTEEKSQRVRQNRIYQKSSVGKQTPATYRQSNHKQTDDLSSKVFITHKKQTNLQQHINNTKYCSANAKQKQFIYLIRGYRRHKGTPSKYLKIPINTKNVQIIQLQTENSRKKRNIGKKVSEICIGSGSCQNCRFCEQYRERREIMRTVIQKLQVIKSSKFVKSQDEWLGDFQQKQNKTIFHKSIHTAYTQLQNTNK